MSTPKDEYNPIVHLYKALSREPYDPKLYWTTSREFVDSYPNLKSEFKIDVYGAGGENQTLK